MSAASASATPRHAVGIRRHDAFFRWSHVEPDVQSLRDGGFTGQPHFHSSAQQPLDDSNVVAVKRVRHGDENRVALHPVRIDQVLAQEAGRQYGRLHRHFLQFCRVDHWNAELFG